MPGTAERWIWRGGAGRPDNAWTIGTFVTARAGRDDAKYAASDGEDHGEDDDEPRKCEHADEVMRALFEARTIGQPAGEADDEAEDRSGDADDGAVRADDETHVTVRRADRLEHADRAHATLREHREAADRHERDQEHAEDEGRERDRLRDSADWTPRPTPAY